VLVGLEAPDDAGIFRLNSETALVQTLDFLTPVTDSPYDFGQIAAANSLSDVYAMGGIPLTAMNIVCFSIDEYDPDVLKETLAGGLDKIHEAGAVLLGGHSVDDREFKYGLSVTGRVHPDRYLTNCGVSEGDQLILTKPVGTGVIATAIKGKIADKKSADALVATASCLNKKAAEIMIKYNPSACTDVTGFGLAGHLLEMAAGGKKKILLDSSTVPFIQNAIEYAQMGLIPAGTYKNKDWCKDRVLVGNNIDIAVSDLLFDPQTSGGLIISLNADAAKECLKTMKNEGIPAEIIGEVQGTNNFGLVTII